MSGQVQSRDKSELARRAKSGGGLSKSGAIFPGQQGSFRWAGPALGASPAELRAPRPSAPPRPSHPLGPSGGPHAPSAPPPALTPPRPLRRPPRGPHTSRDLTRPQWNLRTWR